MNRILKILALGALLGVFLTSSAYTASKKRPEPSKTNQEAQRSTTSNAQENAATATPSKEGKQRPIHTPFDSSVPSSTPNAAAPVIKGQAPSVRSMAGATAPAIIDESPIPSPAAPAAYEITWQSINAGGLTSTSPTYEVSASAGQSAVGSASSPSYDVGAGYWYGVSSTVCNCPFQGDYDADGFLTALDLGALIDVLFAGRPEDQDPLCSTSRGDFDCDDYPTALDLGKLIDYLFAGGPGPCNPCAK